MTHREELIVVLEPLLAARSTAEWVRLLDLAGVPVGPIQSVDEALVDPQIIARGMVTEVQHPSIGALAQINCPIRLTRTPVAVRTAPPLLGQHTDDVLLGAGFSAERIQSLRETGAVA
ncbi:CoA transferase [Cryobacterium aureum]|uniref:CoA transferase n=1 Tax=Cryobacterium aureum TaxID=995037 RepID=UPI001374C6EA|nr:CoA transferase [Cryobacterium aureum]